MPVIPRKLGGPIRFGRRVGGDSYHHFAKGYDMKAICQGIFVFAASAGLVACGSSSQEQTGLLSLGVSDHPIHYAEKVCITFDDVELKPAGDGPSFLVDLPQTKVNLLDFQGMNAAPLLFQEEVPAGDYAWMRLVIDASRGSNGGMGDSGDPATCDGNASYIVMGEEGNTTIHNLYVPSGDQNGLKLGGFTVPVNGSADFTAEWDLMKSITAPPGLDPDVVLKPHIRLVDNIEVGALRGTVSTDLAGAEGCEPAVYVFDNDDPDASDIGIADESVASAVVSPIDETDLTLGYEYEIGHLLTGSYEAAFSCDAVELVEPAEGNPFDIAAREITEVSFP
jgi:hypothetical protein